MRELEQDIALISQAIQQIEAHPEARHTIPELARRVGTSVTRFTILFKDVTGKTVFDYLMELRMRKAIHALETTRKPIVRIANDVSYRNISSFIRAFKRYTGRTPQQWRNNGKS